MEAALGIVITLQVGVIWWVLAHSSQCSAFHERVAKLEERMKQQEEK